MMRGRSFLVGFFKGTSFVLGAAACCLISLQAVYSIGWYLYSIKPKFGARIGTDSFHGWQIDIPADRPTPQSAWLFASDSMPELTVIALLFLLAIVMVASIAAFFVAHVAMLGGWQPSPRIRAMLD